jgi:hypothetical protein
MLFSIAVCSFTSLNLKIKHVLKKRGSIREWERNDWMTGEMHKFNITAGIKNYVKC